jgi:hypothetical protein
MVLDRACAPPPGALLRAPRITSITTHAAVASLVVWCVKARVIQPDETHQVMTTELESGGPRARLYFDESLGAPGRASIVNGRHISCMYSVNASREVLAPYYLFDSTATEAEGYKLDVGHATP